MKIAVIMSTYNGEMFLREQIDSILNQVNVDVELYIRDDGSTDCTREILMEYESKQNVNVDFGNNIGYARSFLEMLEKADDYDYYCFSDQDDYWEPEKLYRACLKIQDHAENKPILYYSNLMVADVNLNVHHVTRLQTRRQTLESVFLRRSIAGNTMVFNPILRDEIFTGELSDSLLAQGHDSFIVSLCYALDGIVLCDENAYIKYRQHGDNTAGAPIGLKARIRKEIEAFEEESGSESRIAGCILSGWGYKIQIEQKKTLELIYSTNKNLGSRIKILLSPSFRTGDIRLTMIGKLRVLFQPVDVTGTE